MAAPYGSYTSVTLKPPPHWTVGTLYRDGQTITVSGGTYTFAPLTNITLARMLSNGFTITALTA